MLNRKIKVLDYVFISHFDSDHCNGFIAVLEALHVKKVIIVKEQKWCKEYETIMKIIKNKKIPVIEVKGGDKISLDSYTNIEILHPQKELIEENRIEQ